MEIKGTAIIIGIKGTVMWGHESCLVRSPRVKLPLQ